MSYNGIVKLSRLDDKIKDWNSPSSKILSGCTTNVKAIYHFKCDVVPLILNIDASYFTL